MRNAYIDIFLLTGHLILIMTVAISKSHSRLSVRFCSCVKKCIDYFSRTKINWDLLRIYLDVCLLWCLLNVPDIV